MTNRLFEESGFKFDFSHSISAYTADKPNYNGLSAVDFIVETANEYLFIEVKNPDNKKAHAESIKQFLLEMQSREYPLKMSSKFKDSLLKELAMGKKFSKPIIYIFFLKYGAFDTAQKRRLYENISNCIPKFIEEDIYKSVKKIRFKLHSKSDFVSDYSMFNVTEL